ncbi:hypothetical protein A3715_04705 [Oleiphilus sp. HI0009]|nr:hypothetical protein A3715_04705 [Oleiphilus sp. HI0009]KZY65989.1 hypothetical protein A3738_07520 [Oleiphilus sp. HI0066]KZY67954.1 hypothetical protein A3739_11545 [Oleiphilus sp. HI0067]
MAGLTWLGSPPILIFQGWRDGRQPNPITWEEQNLLFDGLLEHLREMCLWKVNVGCREQEVCQLNWDWEFEIPELQTSVFILPGDITKNASERIAILNSEAISLRTTQCLKFRSSWMQWRRWLLNQYIRHRR